MLSNISKYYRKEGFYDESPKGYDFAASGSYPVR